MNNIAALWYYIREKFPINRVVTILTPFLAVISGYVWTWAADNLPFVADNLSEGQLTAIFIAGAASAVALAYQWINGKLKWDIEQQFQLLSLPESPDADADTPKPERPEKA